MQAGDRLEPIGNRFPALVHWGWSLTLTVKAVDGEYVLIWVAEWERSVWQRAENYRVKR